MACKITAGYAAGCKGYTVGGANNLYLINKSEIAKLFKNVDGGVIDIVKKETAVVGVYYTAFQVDFQEGTCGGSSELQNDGRNFLHKVILTIPSGTQEVLALIKDLGLSNVVAIIESKTESEEVNFTTENEFHVFGLGNGLKMTVNVNAGGVGEADVSGSTLELTSTETSPHSQVQLIYDAANTPAPTVTSYGEYASMADWIAHLLDDTTP